VPDTAAAGITDCRDRLEPVDRTGAPTHPVPVIRDIGHEIEYVGTRKFADRHQCRRRRKIL